MTEQQPAKKKKGLIFVISAPAGTGKTTLVKKLTSEFTHVVSSVSFTTRPPRKGEINGRDYHFISQAEFEAKIKDNDFLEHVTLYGDYYGTSRSWVDKQLSLGKHVVLVIDTQGALLIKNKIEAVYIFLMPPSMEELKRRLLYRNTDKQQMIETRLEWALKEMEAKDNYDYLIVNENLNVAYNSLRSILIAEELRTKNMI